MQIFNNGKYKSILAAESGELAEIAQTVKKDKDFRPHFHIAPPTGLMNDPNGLIFDGEKYHSCPLCLGGDDSFSFHFSKTEWSVGFR